MPRVTGATAHANAATKRRAKTSLAVSLCIHAAIGFGILGTAWGVTRITNEELPPVVLVADFFSPAPTAAESARTDVAPAVPQNAQRREDASAPDLAERLRALEAHSADNSELDALARRFGAISTGSDVSGDESRTRDDARAPLRAGATFAGLVAGNATKVAYVVDASGSMIGSFSTIVDEVERSLAQLEPTQQFTIIVFRRDGAETMRDELGLRSASRANRAESLQWLRSSVVPAGRSSPIQALTIALDSGADCVFLLSTTITGPGRHELDRASMLQLLERLNPRDASSGRRVATIQCIQFLEEDPGRTLEAVAAEHYGEGGYRFISRSASGLDAPTGPSATPSATPPATTPHSTEPNL